MCLPLKNRQLILTSLLICAVALFYLLNLRGGQDWGDDFALYIQHAQNLVEGKPFAASGYLLNPELSDLSPQAYPPVFPLLLAPFVAGFGINLLVLKLVEVGSLIGFLFLLAYLAKKMEILLPAQLALLAAFGLHPLFWSMTNRILSDLPFLLICTIALIQMQAFIQQMEHRASDGLWIGFLIYLAYGTRTIGLVLLLVLLAGELIAKRRPSSALVVAIGFAIALVTLQALLIPGTGGYLDLLLVPIKQYIRQVGDFPRFYYDSLSYLFPFRDALLRHLLFDITLVLAIFGYLHRLQKGLSIYHWFVPAYLFAILLWPAYQGMRFIIPILPFFLLFAFDGGIFFLRVVGVSRPLQAACLVFVCLALGLSYRDGFKTAVFQRVDNISTAETQAVFAYIRSQIPADAVVVFNKPRALSLFTGRKAVMVDLEAQNTSVEVQLAQFQARYLVLTASDPADCDLWQKYLGEAPDSSPLVYKNSQFWVYQLQVEK